jgi:peptide/nickel transport system substrate-binding protein
LSVVAVRKAVSLALNRNLISVEGESGYETPLPNASGLTLPTFKDWLAPSVDSLKLNAVSETSAAKKVLEGAGFVMGKNGYFETKSGKVVSFTIYDPSSYTDYAEDASIIASELRQVGIEATFVGQTVSAWSADVADGDFESVIHWSNGGITPYNEYNGWLNTALGGKSATGDYEGLHSSAMDHALAKLATAATVPEQVADLAPIEKFVGEELPVIPLVTSAAWCEYNSTHFVGWSSPSNPYESCQPAEPTNEVEILHLAPRS